MNRATQKQLELLFLETDIVYTGDKFELKPTKASEFFCLNPVKDLGSRKLDNIYAHRNLLFEFDGAPLESQYAALDPIQTAIPLRTVTFSGSKSLHLIVSIADTLTVDYKAAWEAIATEIKLITGLEADESCKNPNRLSRLAGFIRPDTGKEQALVSTGNLITNQALAVLISKHSIKAKGSKGTRKEKIESVMSMEEFEHRLAYTKGLITAINLFKYKAAPVGMYPEVLKLTLWAIDATGVPYETFLQFAEVKLFPHLRAANYPEEKITRGIDMAYEQKTSR